MRDRKARVLTVDDDPKSREIIGAGQRKGRGKVTRVEISDLVCGKLHHRPRPGYQVQCGKLSAPGKVTHFWGDICWFVKVP